MAQARRSPDPAKVARWTLVCCYLLTLACGSPEPAPGPAVSARPPVPAPADPGDAFFVDVAAEAGLAFVHFNGMSGELYYSEMMGAGAALFDYDNDGDLDVYLVQGHLLGPGKTLADATFPPAEGAPLGDRLLRNDLTIAEEGQGGRRRTLSFTDVTEESGIDAAGYGMGVAAADFDNDGWTDLYVTNVGRNQLLRNRGARGGGPVSFEDVTEASGAGLATWSVAAAVLDVDRDGWLDLYVGHYLTYSVSTNKRCTDELGAPNYCGPLAFASVPDTLLRNRGGRAPRAGAPIAFEDVSTGAGIRGEHGGCLGLGIGDFDGDGWLDLYAANDGMPNQLWMSRGAEVALAFENRALFGGAAVNAAGHPEASMGVAVADFDDDGDEDIFLGHLRRETNTLYVNDGQGLFTDRSAGSGLGAVSLDVTAFGTGWLDVDNDGRLDLLTVNGAVKVIKTLALAGDPLPLHQPNQLFLQGEGGRFENASERAGAAFQLSEVSRGAAFGDLDNDGDTDVVITNNSGPVRLLENRVGQDRHWLGLRLVGGPGGRDMLGARARLELADGTVRWRRAGTSGSYASASDPRLLFGLGDADSVERVVVEWPDGRREAFGELAEGRYTTLRQGGGRPVAEDDISPR